MTKSKNPCTNWEFRWNKSTTDHISEDGFPEILMEWCRTYCSDWGFQLEQGEKGLVHYQGYIRLVAKKRDPWTLMPEAWQGHTPNDFDPTSNNTLERITNGIGAYYATKADSRIAGPWVHDPAHMKKVVVSCYDLTDRMSTLQKAIVDSLDSQNEREILFVWGDIGCIGKTTLGMHLFQSRDNMIRIPATMESAEDMLQWCYAFAHGTTKETRSTIILDIPRTITGESSWSKYLLALEDIKTGYVYDKRYTAKLKQIYPPKILVFSNKMPSGGLTNDRFVEMPVDEWVAAGVAEPFLPPKRRRLLPPTGASC